MYTHSPTIILLYKYMNIYNCTLMYLESKNLMLEQLRKWRFLATDFPRFSPFVKHTLKSEDQITFQGNCGGLT